MWVKNWFILWHNKFKFKSYVYTGMKTELVKMYKHLSQRQKNLLRRQNNSSQHQKKLSQRQKTCLNVKKTCCTNNKLRGLATSRHKLSQVLIFTPKNRYTSAQKPQCSFVRNIFQVFCTKSTSNVQKFGL